MTNKKNNTPKVTAEENFKILRSIIENTTDKRKDEMIAFIDHNLEKIAEKREKSKERNEAKKAQGDELRQRVFDVLTTEYQTREQITMALGDPEITPAMVTPRLSQLINLGKAYKTTSRIDNTQSRVVYRRLTEEEMEA